MIKIKQQPITRTIKVIYLSHFLQEDSAKNAPYPSCTGTAIWLACRRVPGQLPDAASGNAYYHNRRAVMGHYTKTIYKSFDRLDINIMI